MTKGFIIGATAGRTTLTGEGTQHMDGHSPVLAATNPAVISYDPAYSYEISTLFRQDWSTCTARMPKTSCTT
ncbi:pyruvate dehydrogenase E1 component [Cutibacterium acnes JCM 18909]|nr:pyruvate dehydrogenase E1 component [Cutibacterium acnes JCM 18909]